VPRHPSYLLKIKIKQPYSTSLSLFLSPFLSLPLSFSPSLSFSLSLPLSLSLSFSLSFFFSFSLSLSDRSEGERVACTPKQKVRACSMCSSFSQSVSQSACVIIILMLFLVEHLFYRIKVKFMVLKNFFYQKNVR
jgi:hypothetical protein